LGLSLAEVEQIAAETGIDPKYVRQAALISTAETEDEDRFHFWGGPITIRRSFIVNRPLSKSEMEELVPSMQRITDNGGSTDSLGNSLTWTSHTRQNQGSMVIMMQVEGDKTVCTLKAPVMMPGFLIHYIPLILAFMIGLPFAATRGFTPAILAIAATLMSVMFLATRMGYGKYASVKKDQLKQIEEAIKAVGRSEPGVADAIKVTASTPRGESQADTHNPLLELDEETGPNDGKAREQRRMRE
ncbi:MAG: hypothetical protein HKN13_10380, partial [Rhodothermales bacterium]|nr:hypothetical protein [Rhodothermales bacterium]